MNPVPSRAHTPQQFPAVVLMARPLQVVEPVEMRNESSPRAFSRQDVAGVMDMVENRGTGENLERAFNDMKKQAHGVAKDVKGAARDVYGQARESAGDVAESATDALSKTASSFERALRRTIEEQPYTALLIGIGIGWFLGRTHRPF
jgi:ElaB/YqjD/DUF883 family membrane-anchored ribosome-binding protein